MELYISKASLISVIISIICGGILLPVGIEKKSDVLHDCSFSKDEVNFTATQPGFKPVGMMGDSCQNS